MIRVATQSLRHNVELIEFHDTESEFNWAYEADFSELPPTVIDRDDRSESAIPNAETVGDVIGTLYDEFSMVVNAFVVKVS